MPRHQAEVVHGDSAPLMDLLHRRTGVGLGTAEGGRQEFCLFAFEAVHIRSGEEACQLMIGEHPDVEILDEGFDRLVPADFVVDAVWFGIRGNVPVFASRQRNIWALPVS
jgi:hypothetical protein